MARYSSAPRYDRKLGRWMRRNKLLSLGLLAAIAAGTWFWLQDHPQHNPWAPLDLRHPVGLATAKKLIALKDDVPLCRETLTRSDVIYRTLAPTGSGACELSDRTQLQDYPLAPDTPATTCPVAAALELWRAKTVEPAAQQIFGSELAAVEHLGAYSCRRLYGRGEGPWSEHATANAIDIAGFILADGTRISVLRDWEGDTDKSRFLRTVRDGACGVFATTLSPEYNAAHADHFHFDQQTRWAGVCR